MKKAIYAGSFNPIHKGHLSIIQKASNLFDILYVVVAHNPEKPFSPIEERFLKVKKELQNFKNIEVLSLNKGFLAALAKELDVHYLVRSARDAKDFEYELMLAKANKELNHDLETILIMPDEININIRSSLFPKE